MGSLGLSLKDGVMIQKMESVLLATVLKVVLQAILKKETAFQACKTTNPSL